MRRGRLTVLTAAGAVVGFWGCGGGDAPTGGTPLNPRLVLNPAVVIGSVEGDETYTFGDIRAIAVDDEDRVFVGDRIGATVRVYSGQGTFIEEVAKGGQGPGEIQGWAANLTFGPAGELYVRDAARVMVFARSSGQGVADSLATEWRVSGYGNLTYARSAVGADGAYYYPDGVYRESEPARVFYEVYREGELTGDTLRVPYYEGMSAQRSAFYRLGPRDGRMVQGLSHVPFAAIPTWDPTDRGTVVSTDGRSAHLFETELYGDTVRVLRLTGDETRQVPPEERADSLKALDERIDSLPVRLDAVVNLGKGVADRNLPNVVPSVVSVHIGVGGLIWVERWPAEGSGESRFYDVYDSAGVKEASVELRAPLAAEPAPFFGRHSVVGVTRDPDTGVDRIVRFSLQRLNGERSGPTSSNMRLPAARPSPLRVERQIERVQPLLVGKHGVGPVPRSFDILGRGCAH